MAQWLREMSVGEWFESNGDQFEIVGLDAKAEVVLIQHFNGDLDEMDFIRRDVTFEAVIPLSPELAKTLIDKSLLKSNVPFLDSRNVPLEHRTPNA